MQFGTTSTSQARWGTADAEIKAPSPPPHPLPPGLSKSLLETVFGHNILRIFLRLVVWKEDRLDKMEISGALIMAFSASASIDS